jgi:hypothetical protein
MGTKPKDLSDSDEGDMTRHEALPMVAVLTVMGLGASSFDRAVATRSSVEYGLSMGIATRTSTYRIFLLLVAGDENDLSPRTGRGEAAAYQPRSCQEPP